MYSKIDQYHGHYLYPPPMMSSYKTFQCIAWRYAWVYKATNLVSVSFQEEERNKKKKKCCYCFMLSVWSNTCNYDKFVFALFSLFSSACSSLVFYFPSHNIKTRPLALFSLHGIIWPILEAVNLKSSWFLRSLIRCLIMSILPSRWKKLKLTY